MFRNLLPRGLFGRLRLQMMVLLLLGLLVVDVVAYLGERSIQDREVAMTLDEATQRIQGMPVNLEPVRVGLLDALSPSDLFVAFVGPDQRVLTSSDPVSTDDVPDLGTLLDGLPMSRITRRQGTGGTDFQVVQVPVTRGIRVQVDGGDRAAPVTTVVVGYPMAAKQHALRRLALIEIIGGLLVLAAWYLLSTRFIASGLRPLGEIARTADAIAQGCTDERVEVTENDPDLRRVATALNEAFDARQASEDRMRDFVADASHELRTPLTAVRGWADLYRERGIQDWDGVDAAMTHIWHEAGRMELLVEDMLMLARFDAEPGTAPVTDVPVAALLTDLVADIALLHPGHTYTLQPPDAGLNVLADPFLLRRAVSNLLTNAGRHAPAGSTVNTSTRSTPDLVELRVEDDGPGLSPPEREVAFDRFWRSDRSRGRPGGTGLGLPISRSIVRAMGGDLTLERSPAGGLAAVVRLRRAH